MWMNLLYYVIIGVLVLFFTIILAAVFVAIYERIRPGNQAHDEDRLDAELRQILAEYEREQGRDA